VQIDIEEFRAHLLKKYTPMKAASIIRGYKTLSRHFKEIPSEEEIDQKFKTSSLKEWYKVVLKEIREFMEG